MRTKQAIIVSCAMFFVLAGLLIHSHYEYAPYRGENEPRDAKVVDLYLYTPTEKTKPMTDFHKLKSRLIDATPILQIAHKWKHEYYGD